MIADADRKKLERILEVAAQIDDCIRRNEITEERVLEDRDVQWMLSMPLADIGEQTYALSREFKDARPEGEWSYVSGMRHRLVHNYEGISFAYIAEAIFQDMQGYVDRIRDILEAESG